MLQGKKFNMPVSFYYFSGTGNTRAVVMSMAEEFRSMGMDVSVQAIEDTEATQISVSGVLGIAFPGAIMSTYPLVWSFVKALPEGNGRPFFAVETLGGFTGGAMGPLKTILEKKGYVPLGAKEILMPTNIFYVESPEKNKVTFEKGLVSARSFVRELADGRTRWRKLPILSDVMYAVSALLFRLAMMKWHQWFFRFIVKKEKCTRCGLCIKQCPVHNIHAGPDGFPVYELHCQYCLRCASYCPAGAIPCRFNHKGRTYTAERSVRS